MLFDVIYKLVKDATGDEDVAQASAEAARREWEAAGHGEIDVGPLDDAIREALGDPPEDG